MNSFIGWVGGKKLLRDQIIQSFPPDIGRYIEVFGGAGWVLFRKERHAALEVFNDADGNLINLYRCIKYHAGEVQRELQWCFNSREVFTDFRAQLHMPGLTDIQRAARFFIMVKCSYGSDRNSFGCVSKPGLSDNISSLSDVQKRLARVVIERRDFAQLIKVYDRPDALFYCDPPYVGAESYYNVDFTIADHERLKEVLKGIKGRFLLSYNDAPLVRELYADFHIKEVCRSHNLAARYDGGSYKEVLVSNY
jgi:DNA adenine methylase